MGCSKGYIQPREKVFGWLPQFLVGIGLQEVSNAIGGDRVGLAYERVDGGWRDGVGEVRVAFGRRPIDGERSQANFRSVVPECREAAIFMGHRSSCQVGLMHDVAGHHTMDERIYPRRRRHRQRGQWEMWHLEDAMAAWTAAQHFWVADQHRRV